MEPANTGVQPRPPHGVGMAVGTPIMIARDFLARRLLRLGATPDHLTVAGVVLTCGTGYCLARGASQQVPYFVTAPGPVGWWPTAALVLLLLACACDMLDGAVARLGNLKTRAGAFLDSTADRISDMAIFIGCFLHFAGLGPRSLTLQLLAVLALANAMLISYIKARAENLIPSCSVGWWMRGERCVAVLIGCISGHVPAALWMLAIGCGLSASRRLHYALLCLAAQDTDRPPPSAGPAPGWFGWLQLWRHPRGSFGHFVVSATNISFIAFGPCLWPALLATDVYLDPLGRWLGL